MNSWMRVLAAALSAMLAGLPTPGLGVTGEDAVPLFDSSETLRATLELPLGDLRPGRRKEAPLPGRFSYTDKGRERVLRVNVSPRGNSRLEICDLPPLKLDFQKKQLQGTLFNGQNKLKLVTHCKAGSHYRRYLEHEYALYRSYAALSDAAFRVRRLELTYRDAERGTEKTYPAFLIESDRELAGRLGYAEVDIPVMQNADYDPQSVTLLGLFHFLAGNTDWSLRRGPDGGACCHNGLVLRTPSAAHVIVPYDFDQAGLLNTEYSRPSPALKIRSVRQRVFRGLCTGDEHLSAAIATLNQRRPLIEAEFPLEGSMQRANRRARRYIDGFYKIVNDREQREKRIVQACRGSPAEWQ